MILFTAQANLTAFAHYDSVVFQSGSIMRSLVVNQQGHVLSSNASISSVNYVIDQVLSIITNIPYGTSL
jgi:hypothetical protein